MKAVAETIKRPLKSLGCKCMDHRLLESIIDGVNRHKLPQFRATFVLSGTLVTGRVIPVDEASRALAEITEMSIESASRFVAESRQEFEENKDKLLKPVHEIHVVDAMVYFGNFEQKAGYITLPLRDVQLWYYLSRVQEPLA